MYLFEYIGTGPGPKNVMLYSKEYSCRCVVPYSYYKELQKKGLILAEKKKWEPVAGPIQWVNDDTIETADGEVAVRRATIRNIADNQQYVRLDFFPEWDHVEFNVGDTIFVTGPLTEKRGQDQNGRPRTYYNLTVRQFNGLLAGEIRESGNGSTQGKKKKSY